MRQIICKLRSRIASLPARQDELDRHVLPLAQRQPLTLAGRRARLRQKGVAAIEFALILPIFFLLLYGVITFTLILLAQQTLQMAVSEGARAALRYNTSPTSAAIAAVQAQTFWLSNSGTMTVQATVVTCPYQSVSSCVKVLASYPYANSPLVPTLPFLGLVLPATLSASATIQLEPSVVTSTTSS